MPSEFFVCQEQSYVGRTWKSYTRPHINGYVRGGLGYQPQDISCKHKLFGDSIDIL